MTFSQTKVIAVFTLLFMLMAIVSLIAIKKLQYSASTALAARTAAVLVSTINQARTSYSQNAVAKLRNHPDISIESQYHQKQYAVPNPATFAIELGEAISAPDEGLILHTFSNYPFISRATNGGPQDDFQKLALAKLSQQIPVFERVEMIGNKNVLRHAEAIFMEKSCVDCHNYHPASPKKDWKVGDLRGAVDISIPLSGDDEEITRTVQYAYIIFIAFSLLGFVSMLFTLRRARNLSNELEIKVQQRTNTLNQLARTDALTLIANRRHFEEYAKQVINSDSCQNWPMALIIYDLDHFKSVNDTYGHDIGDECLKAVANAVNEALRNNTDFHARIGGEEFAVILPAILKTELEKVCARILANVHHVSLVNNSELRLTCSIGATLITADSDITLKDMMCLADKALYQAKINGRNQACFLNSEDTY